MNNSIQIFTIIGSILGISAFILNFINPIKDYNKLKWEDLKKVISLDDFEDFYDYSGQSVQLFWSILYNSNMIDLRC
jgi:hypothetical protein